MTNSPVQPVGETPVPSTPAAVSAPGVVSVSTVTTTSVKPMEATDTVPPSTPDSSKPTQTNKKKFSPQMVFAALALLILVVGAGVGFMLLNKNQEIRQQAAEAYSCAGGVAAGKHACSGFRQVAECGPTGFTNFVTCLDTQQCGDIGGGDKGCVNSAPQGCAGGVPNNGKACDTLHSVVTCNNGSFSTPASPCPTVGGVQQICSNGICGGTSNSGACATTAGDAVCRGNAVNSNCLVPGTATTGKCSGNAGGACLCQVATTPTVSPSPGTGGACVALTGACDDVNNKCCSDGVCQGVGSNRRCEARQDTCNDPNSTNDGVCGGGSGGWLGFKCNNLTSGQCLENSQPFSNYQDAYNYASSGGCGQVDEVCNGGYKNRQLCGSFQVIAESCGGSVPTPPASAQPSPQPSPTPGVTPSPSPSPSSSPSPTPAPVCAYIAASKAEIRVGDDVSFTCGIIPGAVKYEFRVQLPDGTISTVNPVSANSNNSDLFHVSQLGDYKAQCRICVGPTATCQEWETL